MSDLLLKREDHGPVCVLTLNRPDRRNALSLALRAHLRDQLDRIAVESRVRAVVLTGEGPVFCSGMDLKEALDEVDSPEGERRAIASMQEYADLVQRIHTFPKAMIAAINGDALAGGAGLAMACDLAVMADGARIGFPEILRGLVPAVVMYDLTRLVGGRRTRQLLLSGEPIDSATAHQWGLVNMVVELESCLAEAIRLADRLSHGGPAALATIKRLLDETDGRPADLRGPAAVSASARTSLEAQEGIRAFIEKRPPAWAVSR